MMIGAQALTGGPVKAITSVAGNLLLTHFFGENIQQAKESAAVRVAAGITPPSVDELTEWNAESKNAYHLGEVDTNGDERVQGAVFVLDIAALGGSSFFARVKRGNSTDKLAANDAQTDKSSRSSIRERQAHHDKMVEQEKARLAQEGNRIADKGISFRDCNDKTRCIPDIVYETPDGKLRGMEIKTGDSKLSKNQEKFILR